MGSCVAPHGRGSRSASSLLVMLSGTTLLLRLKPSATSSGTGTFTTTAPEHLSFTTEVLHTNEHPRGDDGSFRRAASAFSREMSCSGPIHGGQASQSPEQAQRQA